MSHLPIYLNWQTMIQRCENPKHPKYPIYGARGISVCNRWKVFENFYADMGDRPSPHYSIDRYPNNDGNYEPDNCRWATKREQLLNTRRSIAKRARALGARIMSNFDMENTRRELIALRLKFGADTPAGPNWLEVHNGEYGEVIMRSLADLIKLEIKRANDPGRPVPSHGSGP